MPVALAARATVNVPTAVSAAPAPSVMVSVAVAPEVETDASVPPEGTAVASRSGVGGGGERLGEGRQHAVDLAVRVDVVHDQRARDEDRLGPVGRRGGRKRGEVAGGVADAGGVGGERDGERADGGVGAPAPSVMVSVAPGRDGDRGERAARGDVRERPRRGAGRVGGERLGEGGVTRSTLPLALVSCMTATRAPGAPCRRARSGERGLVGRPRRGYRSRSRRATTLKVPTAVLGARRPRRCSAWRSPGSTDARVPPEGTAAASRGGVGGGGERLREGRGDPVDLAVCVDVVHDERAATRTGLAPSAGAVAANEERLPARRGCRWRWWPGRR